MGYWSAVFNINWYKIQVQKTTDETTKYNYIDEDLAYADKNNWQLHYIINNYDEYIIYYGTYSEHTFIQKLTKNTKKITKLNYSVLLLEIEVDYKKCYQTSKWETSTWKWHTHSQQIIADYLDQLSLSLPEHFLKWNDTKKFEEIYQANKNKKLDEIIENSKNIYYKLEKKGYDRFSDDLKKNIGFFLDKLET